MKTRWSVLKAVGVVLALIGLAPAIPGVVQADVEPTILGTFGAGHTHTCALMPSGAVDCWGNDFAGQAVDQPGPYTQLSVGEFHNCALTPSGAVDCWGENWQGEANSQPGPYTEVSAGGRRTCALTPTGEADCWGYQAYDYPGPYTQISSGYWHTCALKSSGEVDCWGDGYYGQAGHHDGPYAQVSAGAYHSCGLLLTGAVDCWGANSYGQAADRDGPYIQVSAGDHHTCAVTPSGAVECWGTDYYGEMAGQAGPYTQVVTGGWHTCALRPSGDVDCWGWNAYGQVNPNSTVAPVADPGGPYLGAVDTAIYFDGSGSYDEDGHGLSYAWTTGDGGNAAGMTPSHTYAEAGIYDVCLTVNDGNLDSDPACTLAVVYDPSAGFVTGGGWIDSPVGAYKPNPTLAGQATFGFVSKYHKGAQVPTGTTEFQFDVAGFDFYSETYEWLVVNQGGANAQFKGSGTVNGGLDQNGNEYKFMIWAGDDTPDTFRIKIWWEDSGTEVVVYDNGADQAIGAGNIVIHTK